MARLVWIGVGAVGGIYVYRKGNQVADAVREQGLGGTAQVVAGAAVAVLRNGQPTPIVPATAAPEPAGLRIGRFRISRADESADTGASNQGALAAGPSSAGAPAAAPAGPIVDTGVVDITDAARRPAQFGRSVTVQLRRKAR